MRSEISALLYVNDNSVISMIYARREFGNWGVTVSLYCQ